MSVLTAALFGAKIEMDAFLAAQTIPNYVLMVVVGGLGFALIPIFSDYRIRSTERKAWGVANRLIILYGSILVFVMTFGIIFSPEILRLTVPGLSEEGLLLASDLMRILWPGTVVAGLVIILTSLYQAYEKFVYCATVTILSSVFYLLFLLLLGKELGIRALAYGGLLSSVLQFAMLIKILSGRFSFQFKLLDRSVRQVLWLQIPLIGSSLFSQGTKIIDRFIASTVGLGAISHINYADKLRTTFTSVLGGGVAVTFFPSISKLSSENDVERLKDHVSYGLSFSWMLSAPFIGLGTVLASPLVRLLFERGAFTSSDTMSVAGILPLFLIAANGGVIANITSRVFYALKDTRTIFWISIGEIALYVIYAPYLANRYGLLGISIAVMIFWNLSLVIQLVILGHRIENLYDKSLRRSMTLITIAAFISSVVVAATIHEFVLSEVSAIVIGTASGILIYVILLMVFRVQEALVFHDMATRFLDKRIKRLQ